MSTSQALSRAQQLDFDLVEVAPQADPPVCKIMDYGKYKYEQDVKAKEARKRQQQVTVKEMKFKPKISHHDYDTKKTPHRAVPGAGLQGQGDRLVQGQGDAAHRSGCQAAEQSLAPSSQGFHRWR